MTRKEAILKIKTLLTATFADESTEVKAEDATTGKLSDGTMVEFSKLEVGGDLSIVAADGVKAPAPIGEYEMEDGTVVSVTEVGKIAAITESGAPKEAEVAAVSAEVATLKAEFKAITEAQAA